MRMSRSWSEGVIRNAIQAIATLLLVGAAWTALPGVASAQRILVYGPGGIGSQPSFPVGSVVTVANEATWRGMTTADFSRFDVIWFDGGNCATAPNALFLAAVETQAAWAPAVAAGRAVYTTADHDYHDINAAPVIRASAAWLGGLGATSEGGKTGVWFSWSCLMATAGNPQTAASFATAFPGITIANTNVETTIATVPAHPTLVGSTAASLRYSFFCHGAISAQPAEWTPLVPCPSGTQAFMVRDAACDGAPPAAGLSVNEGGTTTLSLSGVTAGSTVTWDLDNNGSYETAGPTAAFSGVGRDGPSAVTVGYSIGGVAGTCRAITGTTRVAINNVAPTVTSTAPTSGSPGVVVTYTATATDPAGAADPLTWTLISGPSGAAITPGGVFTWTPTAADVGMTRTAIIEVRDGDGGVTRQTITIRVVECVMASQCNDGIACTVDACTASNTCTNTAVAAGSAGTCAAGTVCSGAPSNTCVQCVTNAQCGGATPQCNTATNRCVQCLNATHCSDSNACTTDACTSNVCSNPALPAGTMCATGVCDGTSASLCVACVDNAMDTMTDSGCSMTSPLCLGAGAAASCQACSDTTVGGTDLGCAMTAPACSTASGTNVCVTCEDSATGIGTDNGCGDGAPICNVGAAGGPSCVACLSATDCADTNVCTTEACVSNACVITPVDAGETGMCADALVCSGPAGTTPNSCVQCTSNDQCADPTAFCDTVANTCGPCTADFSGTGAACPEANPFCAFTGPTMGVCGRCTTNADCEGHTGGPLCDLVSGGCGTACNVDADCADGEWCPDSRVCAPQVPNGMSVPAAGPASGMCTETIGTRTCISGVCFEDDDLCGLPTGETCADEGVCRSAICASNGLCGDCDSNDDCMGGRVCVVSTGTCVMPDGGMPDAGPGDAGPRDAGASTFDAGDAGPTPGGLAGGSCGCAVNTTQGNSGILAMLGMLALVVARKRRQR